MKLAVVSSEFRGEVDKLLSEMAARLQSEDVRLAGVVKVQQDNNPVDAHACEMDLRVLPTGPLICITQSLGEGSVGCRLNPAGITKAVAAVEQEITQPMDLFILNKFGPQEAEGHGFCAAIGSALEHGTPVLVGVGKGCREAFETFAGGMAETLPPDAEAIHDWCIAAMATGGTQKKPASEQPTPR
jgi:uncharacterized protein DUF2478